MSCTWFKASCSWFTLSHAQCLEAGLYWFENVSNLDRDATNIDQMLDKSKIGLDNLRILLENNNVSVDNVSKTQHEDSLDLSIDILDEDDFEVDNHAIVDDDQNSVFVQSKTNFWYFLPAWYIIFNNSRSNTENDSKRASAS